MLYTKEVRKSSESPESLEKEKPKKNEIKAEGKKSGRTKILGMP